MIGKRRSFEAVRPELTSAVRIRRRFRRSWWRCSPALQGQYFCLAPGGAYGPLTRLGTPATAMWGDAPQGSPHSSLTDSAELDAEYRANRCTSLGRSPVTSWRPEPALSESSVVSVMYIARSWGSRAAPRGAAGRRSATGPHPSAVSGRIKRHPTGSEAQRNLGSRTDVDGRISALRNR